MCLLIPIKIYHQRSIFTTDTLQFETRTCKSDIPNKQVSTFTKQKHGRYCLLSFLTNNKNVNVVFVPALAACLMHIGNENASQGNASKRVVATKQYFCNKWPFKHWKPLERNKGWLLIYSLKLNTILFTCLFLRKQLKSAPRSRRCLNFFYVTKAPSYKKDRFLNHTLASKC